MQKLKNKVKVSRDFVLKRIEPYISLAQSPTENIYEKDYTVIHNNNVLKGEHIKISIENDLIEANNIEIAKNTVSFYKNSLDIEVGFFSDLVREEKIYFQIDLSTEIKILTPLEQYHEINNKYLKEIEFLKETKFLNIMYPSFAGNMQQGTFLFKNSRLTPIENSLFYELSFYTIEKEKINSLRYFYKKTLSKNFLIPREKVLKCYEYEG